MKGSATAKAKAKTRRLPKDRCRGIIAAHAMRVSILTVSDSVATGKHADGSGPAVAGRCRELGWEIVSAEILPDDCERIADFLRKTADAKVVDLILTTGGTGVGPRDVTPEATISVTERLIPGFAEQMRAEGLKKTPRAILSRGAAGIRGDHDDCEFAGKSARGGGIVGRYCCLAASRRGCAARRTPLGQT